MPRNIIFVLNLGGWAIHTARRWNAFAYIFKGKSEGKNHSGKYKRKKHDNRCREKWGDSGLGLSIRIS
jgi:hypothetical protein